MKIKAIRFLLKSGDVQKVLTRLSCATSAEVSRLKHDSVPALYVVCDSYLDVLSQYKDIVIDRGVKHSSIPLARYLLHQERIPLLKGNFKSAVQIQRSIRDFLKKAKKEKENNICLITVSEEIFEELKGEKRNLETNGERKEIFFEHKNLQLLESSSKMSKVFHQQKRDEETFQALQYLEKIFIGVSDAARKIRNYMVRAARVDAEVIILGETGSGKEVVAKGIHYLRFQDGRDWQVINCSAVSENLFESELFGYKKGSFTGAVHDKQGLWPLANDSSLFLDEIGDLPREQQAKILRALSDNKVRPVGGEKEITVNARIIAATNVDLVAKVKYGEFREDLFHRLNTFPIFVPPLRDRREDIPVLAMAYWDKILPSGVAPLPDGILKELQSRDWPGNVRVLHSFLRFLKAWNFETIEQGISLNQKDLQLAFDYHDQSHYSPNQQISEDAVILHPANCLRRLKRVSDILFSLKIAILSVVETDSATNLPFESLQIWIQELAMHCENEPSLFHSVPILNSVWRLVKKLMRFYDMLSGELENARTFLVQELSEELTLTMEIVFREIDKITKY